MELVLAVLIVLGLFIIWFRSLNYQCFNSPGGDGHGAGSSSLNCFRSFYNLV